MEVNRRAFKICKLFDIPNYILPPSLERPFKENCEVANLLLLIAYFKEKREGNPYVAWAYHKAAESIENLSESIEQIRKENRLRDIQGVGRSLAETISEFLDTGKCERLEQLRSRW